MKSNMQEIIAPSMRVGITSVTVRSFCDAFVRQHAICDAHNKAVLRGADWHCTRLIPITYKLKLKVKEICIKRG